MRINLTEARVQVKIILLVPHILCLLCNFKLINFQNFNFDFRFGFKTEEQSGEKVKGLRNNRNREHPVKMTSQRTNSFRRAMSQRWRTSWR